MSRKISWISTSYYPLFLGATCFFLVFYKFFPSPFALILNSCLLIVCTILFLRILGRYGRNGRKENLTLRSSSLRVELIKNDLRAKKLESLKCNPQARSRRTFKRMTVRAVAPGDDIRSTAAACRAVDEDNGFNIQMHVTCVSSTILLEEDKDGDEFTEKLAEGFLVDMGQEETCLAAENFADFGEHADKIKSDNGDSCLGSSWCHVDHHDACSSAEFDGGQSSDLCAAKLDPRVSDENMSNEVAASSENQVMGSSNEKKEKEQLEEKYTGDGDQTTEQLEKEYTGGGDQETEQVEKEYTGDGDQETGQLEKYSGDGDQETEQVEKECTGDGEQETEQLEKKKHSGDGNQETEQLEKKKNTGDGHQETREKNSGNKVGIKLMDLGVSESERNRRLESLIAKRKARKAMERNVKDLDDSTETSGPGSQLPSITAGRRNSSDLLYDFDESLPGSAPSILLPRMSVFDLSEEADDDDDDDDNEYITTKNFVTHPLREILFTRHESFTVGASFFSDVNPARRASRFRPFVGEAKNEEPEDTSGAHLDTSLGEVCEPKFSFTSESDTDSTISDLEHEEDLAQDSEYCPIQPTEGSSQSSSSLSSDIELMNAKQISYSGRMNIGSEHCPIQTNQRSSQSSSEEDIELMDVKQVNTTSRMDIGCDHATQVVDGLGMIRDDVSEVSVSSSLITYADHRPEVIDDKHAINYYLIPPGTTVEEEFGLKQKINDGESSTEFNKSITLDSDVANAAADEVHVETLNNAGSASKTECSDLAFMEEGESESKEINVCRDEAPRAEGQDLSDSVLLPSLPEEAVSHSMMHHSNIPSSMEIEPIKNS